MNLLTDICAVLILGWVLCLLHGARWARALLDEPERKKDDR